MYTSNYFAKPVSVVGKKPLSESLKFAVNAFELQPGAKDRAPQQTLGNALVGKKMRDSTLEPILTNQMKPPEIIMTNSTRPQESRNLEDTAAQLSLTSNS